MKVMYGFWNEIVRFPTRWSIRFLIDFLPKRWNKLHQLIYVKKQANNKKKNKDSTKNIARVFLCFQYESIIE